MWIIIPAQLVMHLIVGPRSEWSVTRAHADRSVPAPFPSPLQAFSDDPDTTSADLVADILLSQAISLRSSDDVTIMVLDKQAA
jgi:hypothetical protein